MNFHNYIEKLRNLPDKQKKIIVWTIAGILAVLLGILWFKMSVSRFEKFQGTLKDIEIPSFEEIKTE